MDSSGIQHRERSVRPYLESRSVPPVVAQTTALLVAQPLRARMRSAPLES